MLKGGGVGGPPECAPNYSLDKTSIFCAGLISKDVQKRALRVPRSSIRHKQKWPKWTFRVLLTSLNAQMRFRSMPVDPNAFPMCSDELSLDACRSK